MDLNPVPSKGSRHHGGSIYSSGSKIYPHFLSPASSSSSAVIIGHDDTATLSPSILRQYRPKSPSEVIKKPLYPQVSSILLSGDEADASDKYDEGESLSSFSNSDNDSDCDGDGDDHDHGHDHGHENGNENDKAISSALDDSTSSIEDFHGKRIALKENATTISTTNSTTNKVNKRQRLINSFREQSKKFLLTAQQQQQSMNYPLNNNNNTNTNNNSNIVTNNSSSSSAASGASTNKGNNMLNRSTLPTKRFTTNNNNINNTTPSCSQDRGKPRNVIIPLVIEDYDFQESTMSIHVGDILEIKLADSVPSHAEHLIFATIINDEALLSGAATSAGEILFESPLLQVFISFLKIYIFMFFCI